MVTPAEEGSEDDHPSHPTDALRVSLPSGKQLQIMGEELLVYT